MGVGDITLEAARSSIRGGGWVPSGPRPRSGSAELPTAARRALRRHRGRAQLMCLFFQRSIYLSIEVHTTYICDLGTWRLAVSRGSALVKWSWRGTRTAAATP